MGHDEVETLGAMIQDLVGCDWGRRVLTGTPGVDLSACEARAAQRMAIHDPASGQVILLQFCTPHFGLMESETNPHGH